MQKYERKGMIEKQQRANHSFKPGVNQKLFILTKLSYFHHAMEVLQQWHISSKLQMKLITVHKININR